ncbi:ExbD/TolR family protein [Persicirhabdus sediminis]|uniref:Biopolymer transporter ExbD n=1 Tax=Persicirhabdus sediminis TaxID=454144 RepID=A0A8J7MFJ7_9BACT|nr:biopolymer transporter ExbD [Persicirhabdus sediminis]MBK1792531.1 biopolymer transporter ExbD [Persicirhabdus sediminis]
MIYKLATLSAIISSVTISFAAVGDELAKLPAEKSKQHAEKHVEAGKAKPAELRLYTNGTFALDGKKVNSKELAKLLAALSAENKNQAVKIIGDAKVEYQKVVVAIDACQKAGLWNVTFATTELAK